LAVSELGTIVVVDDGSRDATPSAVAPYLARDARMRLIVLPENQGKGAAMEAGVLECEEPHVLFLDADLIGLQPGHVRGLIEPVRTGTHAMTIGVFRDGRPRVDRAHQSAPWLTGQRCLSRSRFLAVPGIAGARMGVELALTMQARRERWLVKRVALSGVTHTPPEEKRGLWPGLRQRGRMYVEIGACWLRAQRARNRSTPYPRDRIQASPVKSPSKIGW
jgi:glycosyltransferase involved in cell wall biosynthesis